MNRSSLLLLPSYQGFDSSFNEKSIDIGIPTKDFCITSFAASGTFPELCNEYDVDLWMLEPTPIGPNIDIVKSLAIPQDPDLQQLSMTLEQVADILSDSCRSKRPRDNTCHDHPVSVKRQKMYCSIETPFSSESIGKIKLTAPSSLPSTMFILSSDIPTRPLQSTISDKESFPGRKTPYNEFRSYQVDHWATQYEAMVRFRNTHNHCFVPHQYPENPALSSWVKRQRYQYKVMKAGRHSTLTPEGLSKLVGIGFIWDSHKAIWEERYADLCRYQEMHGHTNVPVKCSDKSLGIWVQCQRRQHRLYRQGKPSSMTQERIIQLENIGFDWNPPIGCPCKHPASGM